MDFCFILLSVFHWYDEFNWHHHKYLSRAHTLMHYAREWGFKAYGIVLVLKLLIIKMGTHMKGQMMIESHVTFTFCSMYCYLNFNIKVYYFINKIRQKLFILFYRLVVRLNIIVVKILRRSAKYVWDIFIMANLFKYLLLRYLFRFLTKL